MSSNDWIIMQNEIEMRCHGVTVAYFKVISRYLSGRDSEKPRKHAVNRAVVPLENQTALSLMQFRNYSVSFDFPKRFSIILHDVNFGLD